jgi:glutathione S-transferase
MEYLEERYPEPPLLPADPADRALARLAVDRFDDVLGDDYYAFRRGDDNRLAERLERLPLGRSLYVDAAYVPWLVRARDLLGVELPDDVSEWLAGVAERPPFAEELRVVASPTGSR